MSSRSPRRDRETGEPSSTKQRKGEKRDEDGQQQQQQRRDSSAGGQVAASPRNNRRNKIYRTPPTPEPKVLHVLEKQFTLDCIAVDTTSNDYAKVKPKLGQVTPPYNAQKDKGAKSYLEKAEVQKILKRNGQAPPGTAMEGPAIERFHESGAGYLYLYYRNQHGAGHSRDAIDGHGHFMSGVQPIRGYNGEHGYRRNNPKLRRVPSEFGVVTHLPIHE